MNLIENNILVNERQHELEQILCVSALSYRPDCYFRSLQAFWNIHFQNHMYTSFNISKVKQIYSGNIFISCRTKIKKNTHKRGASNPEHIEMDRI